MQKLNFFNSVFALFCINTLFQNIEIKLLVFDLFEKNFNFLKLLDIMQTEKIEASHSSTKGKFCKQYYETSLKLQPITLPTWTYIYISVYTDKCCRFSWQSCLNTGMCPFYSCGCLKGSKRDQRDL